MPGNSGITIKSTSSRLIQIPVQSLPGSNVKRVQGTPALTLKGTPVQQGTSIAIAPVENENVQSVLVKTEPELTEKGEIHNFFMISFKNLCLFLRFAKANW